MSYEFKRPHMLLLGLTGLIVLGGCSSASYRDLNDAYSKNQYSDYYYEEVSRVDAILPQQDDSFLNSVNTAIANNQAHWQKAVDDKKVDAVQVVDVDDKLLNEVASLTKEKVVSALAQEADLQKILAIAITRNPDIKAAESRFNGALQRFPQAVNLDTILNQYNAFTRELDTIVGGKPHKEMVAMSFPAPGTLALKGNVIDQDVLIALKRYEIAKRNLAATLRTAFFAYDYLKTAIQINRENQKLLEDIIKVTQTKYQTDRAKYGNVIMAQVELAQITNAIITLEQDLATVVSHLNTLMDLPVDTPLGSPKAPELVTLTATPDTVQATGLRHRQEVQIQTAMLNRVRLMVDMAEKMSIPDPTLGHSYFESKSLPATQVTGRDAFSEKHLPQRQAANFGHRDAYVNEMRQLVKAQEKQVDAITNDTAFSIKKGLFKLDASYRSFQLHRDVLLPQAKQALKASETAYKTNKIGFIEYLDSQRTLLKLRLSQAQAVRDYQTALARLDQLAGRALPRKPVEADATAEPETQ